MKRNLNKRFIKALKCTGKVYEVNDTKIRGFSVRMHRKGSISLSLRYTYAGKRKRYTLCKYYPDTCMDEVRELATSLSLRISQGIDIQAEREKEKQEKQQEHMTVKDICEEYMKKGCIDNALSTQGKDNGHIERHIKPLIGKIKLVDLTGTHVENMRSAIKNGKTAKKAKKVNPKSQNKRRLTVARDCVKLVSAILNYAIKQGYITKNVTPKVGALPKPEKLPNFYSDDDYADASIEMNKPEIYGEKAINIMKLIGLTGCRRTEIESLRWENIKFNKRRIEFKHTKTGARTVYLATPVMELLRSIQPSNQSDYVFPSDRKNTYYKNTSQKWRLMREKAGIVRTGYHCRLHDFRHSFCSIANELGCTEQTIAALVGHSTRKSTTARYIHHSESFLIQEADRIANAISKKMQGHKTVPVCIPTGKRSFGSATKKIINNRGDKLKKQNLIRTVLIDELESEIKT